MGLRRFRTVAIALALVPVASAPAADYVWQLPKGFPKPRVPADNPMSAEKVELGRYLFYDRRMSATGKYSCASCHKQALAFTDGKAVAEGATGQKHSRSAMSLVNVAYSSVLTWSNPNLHSLEEQALTPMFGEHPVELGLKPGGEEYLKKLRGDAKYREMFHAAFPGETDPIAIANVTKAIASFERTIVSGNSPYDRYHYGGDDSAVPEEAKRGEVLFFSVNLSCFRCHGGFNFSDATGFARSSGGEFELDGPFHNTALYNPFIAPNLGIYEFTKKKEDIGKFKAPTLRNIGLTAPYMHDGSVPSLDAVLDHYSAGGRAHGNPDKDPLLRAFTLTKQDRLNLVAFLRSLTDETLLTDPRFSAPN